MPTVPFVHLHTHSCYSLLDGAIRIPVLVDAAVEMGMRALALTDHGNMFGAMEFLGAAQKAGVHPVLGMEAYVTVGPKGDRTQGQRNIRHLVLLARNSTGYKNLVQLSTIGYLEGYYYRPRIDHEDLERHCEGLIALSACLKGEVPQLLLEGREDEALRVAHWYRERFGADGFFLEVQNHGIPEEQVVLPRLVALSRATGIPLVATNDPHYLRKEHAESHRILLSISAGKPTDSDEGLRFSSTENYFKSPEEMHQLFAELPQALERTLAIAESCAVDLGPRQFHLPTFPLPNGFHSPDEYLRHLVDQGAQRRYGQIPSAVRERLDYELEVISQKGLAAYFLIVHDFVREAKARGIPMGPGRGSAASSLVCYCLGITHIDPLVYGLSFERFLNRERDSMPDIDLDFCQDRRDELIQYAIQKYGADCVAHIASFGNIKAKAAVRDVGRVLGLSFEETDVLSKMVPDGPDVTLEAAMQASPELARLVSSNPKYQELWNHARVLEGIARHSSTHPAGLVISPVPLREIVPLFRPEREADGMVTTQYDMKSLDRVGLLKIDLLGLRTVTVVAEILSLIASHRGITVDLDSIPLDDRATYALLARGETVGVFQVEGAGMTSLLRRMEPDCFNHIIAVNALFRPGPLEIGAPRYVECRHGRQPVVYAHPDLEPILSETYGVFLYQEQVMRAAQVLAGFSAAKADVLRSAMSKKKGEEFQRMREEFLQGAVARGIDRSVASKVFDEMERFGGYAFNKAHATAYGLLIYQTAYLKAHFPTEFMCATLSSFLDQTDRLKPLIEECRRLGIEVAGPDVNRSQVRFSIDGGRILYGLAAVKSVGIKAAEAVVAARAAGGPFVSLWDFVRRVDPALITRPAVEALIKAGAFDGLCDHRASLLEAVGQVMEQARRTRKMEDEGQLSLFEGQESEAPYEPPLPQVNPWSMEQRLEAEREALGFHFSCHPLDRWSWLFSPKGLLRPGECTQLEEGARVVVGGIVTSVRNRAKDGKGPCRFASLEDERGNGVSAAMFDEAYRETEGVVAVGALVALAGRIRVRNGERQLTVSKACRMEDVPRWVTGLTVTISAVGTQPEALALLRHVLEQYPGRCPVYIEVAFPDGSAVVVLARDLEVEPREDLVDSLKTLDFVTDVALTVGAQP